MARKRKNGDGMLRLRSDGRWEARLLIGYTDKGKAITKNVTAKDKDDCIKKFEELKEKYEASKKDEVSPHMCFGDWLIFWYENYSKPRLRVGTRQNILTATRVCIKAYISLQHRERRITAMEIITGCVQLHWTKKTFLPLLLKF